MVSDRQSDVVNKEIQGDIMIWHNKPSEKIIYTADI